MLSGSLQLAPRLIVFDLDGTLIDSRLDLANAVNSTLVQLDRTTLPEQEIAGFIGDGATALVERSLVATGGSEQALLQTAMPVFFRTYRRHETDHTYVYDGVLTALDQIRQQVPGILLGVLTNKPVCPSRRICEALGLAPFFFVNYGGDSFTTKKPEPEGLLAIMTEASQIAGAAITPEETVMVGDSDVDIRTARAAGTWCVGCTWGFAREALIAAQPDALAQSPIEWPSLLVRAALQRAI